MKKVDSKKVHERLGFINTQCLPKNNETYPYWATWYVPEGLEETCCDSGFCGVCDKNCEYAKIMDR